MRFSKIWDSQRNRLRRILLCSWTLDRWLLAACTAFILNNSMGDVPAAVHTVLINVLLLVECC
jgi:hypothetical protein